MSRFGSISSVHLLSNFSRAANGTHGRPFRGDSSIMADINVVCRKFHSSRQLRSDEKDNDGNDPTAPKAKPDEKDDDSSSEPGDMIVERRGRRRSSGSAEIGLVKRDSKWIPSEVLVIPVYRFGAAPVRVFALTPDARPP